MLLRIRQRAVSATPGVKHAVAMLTLARYALKPPLHFCRDHLRLAAPARSLALDSALIDGLTTYRERFGHVRVPLKFVVPLDAEAAAAWPDSCRGLPLGQRLARIRMRYKRGTLPVPDTAELDELGFVWDLGVWRWERALAALRTFHRLEGDLSVPRSYVVPAALPWPEDTHGLKLGVLVNNIRSELHFVRGRPERAAQLDALDFVWDAQECRWEHVLAALCGYRGVHGDLLVPQSFRVPAEPPWPEEAWGMRLGSCVNNIRGSERFVKGRAERRAELDALGFVWNCQDRRWELVLSALHTYYEEHGDLLVPKAFTVPPAPPWPEAAWGLKLGHRLTNIRASELYVKGRPERHEQLNKLGMCWNGGTGAGVVAGTQQLDGDRWAAVMAALGVFKELHGHMSVPADFMVPAEKPWPPISWGSALGMTLRDVHSRRDRLELKLAPQHVDVVEVAK